MNKKIYSFLTLLVICITATSSCKNEEDDVFAFSTKLNAVENSKLYNYIKSYPSAVRGGSLSNSNPLPYLSLIFSTDGGNTFVQYPILKVGQEYVVKLVLIDNSHHDNLPGIEVVVDEYDGQCYEIDWSNSVPKPVSTNVANGTATFVLGDNNRVEANIEDLPVNVADLAGDYTVINDVWEDYHPGDELTITQVDATHIQIEGYPATQYDAEPLILTITNLNTGTVNVESQNNGSYNSSGTQAVTTTGSGTVASCNGSISLVLNFSLPCCGSYNGNSLVLQKN